MKTVFFSIASKLVMRNLFLVPEGVFDILKNRSDIKLVLILNDKLYKINENHFRNFSSPNVVIEIVKSGYKTETKNIIQSIFVFFYSYLIFTSTTRLIASKGARADITTAKGHYYLYQLKWLNYILFGHSRFIKEKLVPKLYFHIFKERPYKVLFDKYRPDLIFLPNIAHSPDLELLAEAKRQRVQSVGMCGSWDHFNKYFVPLRSDILLAWNEPLKREALEYERYKPEQIKLVGFPQFDAYLNKAVYISREEFLKNKKLPPDSKVIFFASEGAYSLDGPDIIDMMVKWIERGKLSRNSRIILRLYPGFKAEEKTYERFFNHPLVYVDSLDNWTTRDNFISFINTIRHSDVVISTYSTISVEAAVFNKPLININFDGYHIRSLHKTVRRLEDFSHFRHVSMTGALVNVESQNELLMALKSYLNNPLLDEDKRVILQNNMCHKLDGKTSERIVENLVSCLHEQK